MSEPWRDRDYLDHILAAIDKINRYTQQKSETEFRNDSQLHDAVIRNLEIIGEAVTQLSDDFKARHTAIPWRQIAGMHNRLIHAYMTVNLDVVWSTVQNVLPGFEQDIRALQAGLNECQ